MRIFLYVKNFRAHGREQRDGTCKAAAGLAYGLVAHGAEVSILCEGKTEGTTTAREGYTVHCFLNENVKPSFKLSPGLVQFVESQGKGGLFVLNGIFHPSMYAMSKLLRKHRIRYIVAPHNPHHPMIFKPNSALKWPYFWMFEKKMLRKAMAVQLLDERHKPFLRKLGIKTRTITTPNGFSDPDLVSSNDLRWYDGSEPIKLLYFGRLAMLHKGIDLLVDAFATICQSENMVLTIQGPGEATEVKERASELADKGKVRFVGPVYDRSPASVIAEHDIFCMPSRFEGFGLAALEAMLAGRVIVVSADAGIAPHIAASGCGVLVQPTVEGVRFGLIELLRRKSEWKQMGLRGRDYAIKKLRWKEIAESALLEYEQIMKL